MSESTDIADEVFASLAESVALLRSAANTVQCHEAVLHKLRALAGDRLLDSAESTTRLRALRDDARERDAKLREWVAKWSR